MTGGLCDGTAYVTGRSMWRVDLCDGVVYVTGGLCDGTAYVTGRSM